MSKRNPVRRRTRSMLERLSYRQPLCRGGPRREPCVVRPSTDVSSYQCLLLDDVVARQAQSFRRAVVIVRLRIDDDSDAVSGRAGVLFVCFGGYNAP